MFECAHQLEVLWSSNTAQPKPNTLYGLFFTHLTLFYSKYVLILIQQIAKTNVLHFKLILLHVYTLKLKKNKKNFWLMSTFLSVVKSEYCTSGIFHLMVNEDHLSIHQSTPAVPKWCVPWDFERIVQDYYCNTTTLLKAVLWQFTVQSSVHADENELIHIHS